MFESIISELLKKCCEKILVEIIIHLATWIKEKLHERHGKQHKLSVKRTNTKHLVQKRKSALSEEPCFLMLEVEIYILNDSRFISVDMRVETSGEDRSF